MIVFLQRIVVGEYGRREGRRGGGYPKPRPARAESVALADLKGGIRPQNLISLLWVYRVGGGGSSFFFVFLAMLHEGLL